MSPSISAAVLTTNLSGKRVKLLSHCHQPVLWTCTALEGRREGGWEGGEGG